MAEAGPQYFSDEVIWRELRNLGYNDVDQELFQLVKHEMLQALQQQQERENASSPSPSITSSFVSSSSSTNSALSITLDPEAEERHRFRFQMSIQDKGNKAVPGISHPTNTNSRNKNVSNQSDSGSSDHSVLRRKAFRYVNGKRIVTEELRALPHYSGKENNVNTPPLQRNLSCPNVDSALSPTSDLCVQMSCVSVNSRSSGSSERSRSESRSTGVLLPNLNVKRKKCDPVSRYHEYKKYWDTFKLPGENNHRQLRWTVREKMLDLDIA